MPSTSDSGFLRAALLQSLFFLTMLILFLDLPQISTSTEAREGRVVFAMLDSGDWILPSRDGRVPSKPPFYHWISAALTGSIDRLTPFTVRLPSALFAALSLLLTTLLAHSFAGSLDGSQRSRIALLSGAILSLCYGFTILGLRAQVDMIFAFFVLLALFFPVRRVPEALRQSKPPTAVINRGDMVYFYGACGFAVLCKGPLGIALPVLILAVILLSSDTVSRVVHFFLTPSWGWLLCLGIGLPWYFLAYRHAQGAFVERQIMYENVRRLTGWGWDDVPPVWHYVPKFLGRAVPFSAVFLFCVGKDLLSRPLGTGDSVDQRAIRRPLWWWFFGVFIFFSLAAGKRQSYLVPLYPPMCIYLGLAFSALRLPTVIAPNGRRFLLLLGVTAIAAAAAICALLPWVPLSSGPLANTQAGLADVWWRFSLPLLCLTVIPVAVRNSPRLGAMAAWATVSTLLVASIQFGLFLKGEMRGYGQAARSISSQVGNEPLSVEKEKSGEHLSPLLFYLNRAVPLVSGKSLEAACPGWAVVMRNTLRLWYEQSSAPGYQPVREVSSFSTSGSETRREKDEYVLIRCEMPVTVSPSPM